MRRIGPAAVLLLAMADPAAGADKGGMVLWDRHLASTMNELLVSDDPCRQGPYRIYRQTCGGNELDLITLERHEATSYTLLDRVALFIHRYKDVNVNHELRPGTTLGLKAKLNSISEQEAEVRLTLDIRF